MLGLPSAPESVFQMFEGGQRLHPDGDELWGDSSPVFLISIKGGPETVALIATQTHATASMACPRTDFEYVLGAATAIA